MEEKVELEFANFILKGKKIERTLTVIEKINDEYEVIGKTKHINCFDKGPI